MQRPVRMMHGVIGGLIAGGVVALWFLGVDLAAGSLFLTPTVLGSMAFQQPLVYPSLRLFALYSVLHFAAFATLGALWVGFLHAIRAEPGLGLGLFFGVVVLNAFHYSALLLGGVTALIVLPPLHVLLANFAGGMAFMLYLHRVSRSNAPLGVAALLQYPLLRRGFGVGLLGAGAVAIWFLVVDVLTRYPFHTPAALGSALFLGAQSGAEVKVTLAVITAYTLVHVTAFCAVGTGFVWLADRAQRVPERWLMVVLTLVVLEGLFLGTVGAVGRWVLQALGWWAVIAANLIAVLTMAGAVWVQNPELRRRFLQGPVETAV